MTVTLVSKMSCIKDETEADPPDFFNINDHDNRPEITRIWNNIYLSVEAFLKLLKPTLCCFSSVASLPCSFFYFQFLYRSTCNNSLTTVFSPRIINVKGFRAPADQSEDSLDTLIQNGKENDGSEENGDDKRTVEIWENKSTSDMLPEPNKNDGNEDEDSTQGTERR